MIRSMTGYGSAKGTAAGFNLGVEIRSVNNRYLDLNVKLPRSFLFAEERIKSLIQKETARGKVDVFVTLDAASGEQARIRVNDALASAYRGAVTELGAAFSLMDHMTALDLAKFPDVLVADRPEIDQEVFLSELGEIVGRALADFNAMRQREGAKLAEDVLLKADRIEELVGEIAVKAPETLKAYRERLERKLREVLEDTSVAEERLIAEAAVYADRIATDEEIVRLRSHLAQFRLLVAEGSPVGRKLDFLIQEFNREANTIGSKCQDSAIAWLVVDLKSEIEKIREQIQNME